MQVGTGQIRRLIVNMPPQYGKSELISRWFPLWTLEWWPTRRIIIASYELSVARRWGRRIRNDIEAHPDLLRIRLSADSTAAQEWELAAETTDGRPAGGSLFTAGAGGPITGRPADLFIIDDPYKGLKEAHSPLIRERVWEWYTSVVRPRLSPDGAIVLVQTRWHQDDLTGRLLQRSREPWVVVRMPAIAEEPEDWGFWRREPGEPLWPERDDEAALETIRHDSGPYTWAAIWQQRPAPPEGALFRREHFRYAELAEDGQSVDLIAPDGGRRRVLRADCTVFATWDLATSESQQADYTVCAVWWMAPDGTLILVDVIRERLPHPRQLQLAEAVQARWGAVLHGIEAVGYQLGMVQEAVAAGLPAVELRVPGDKWLRALSIAAWYEAGRVYHRRAPWLATVEDELLAFPAGLHDDIVDAVAYAYHMAERVRRRRPRRIERAVAI